MTNPGDDHAITRVDGSPMDVEPLAATENSERGVDPDAPRLPRGSALGRYLVVDRLGAGGMGVVYRAFDPDLDRSVALKLVGTGTGTGGSESDHEQGRLLREAQAMARLSHPNVIPVFDVGILDDAVFVAMELVDGVTLRRWLDTPRTPEEILDVFRDAGQGVAAAHAAELIHRDFKPDNVMIGHDGRVRVLDFGLARAIGSEPTLRRPELDDLRASTRDSLDRSMTVEGAVVGTPAYMSPEQHLGGSVDAASDQFSFCVALFEALYGARPFRGKTMATLAMAVMQGKITMPDGARGKAPGWVLAAITRGLSVDPDARFPRMVDLLEALSHDPARRRRRRAGLGLGAVGVLGLGTLLGTGLGATPATDDPAVALCTGAADALAATWSNERRDGIGRAFADSGVGFASETWTATAAILDARAEAWVAEHTAACRATRITGEQSTELLDRRMACLDRQRQRLDALATALATPDAQSIDRAFDAARRLPPAERCRDLAALNARTPPPDDPAARAEQAELSGLLDAVRAQLGLGHVKLAREQLEPLLPRVEALDFPPLSSEALGLHAELLEQTGDVEDGRRAREQAHAAAVASGDAQVAAEHARAMVFTVGYRLSDPRQGGMWLELGRASLRRLGGDAELEARFHSVEGAMMVAAGRHDEALAAHGRARTYWQEHDADGPELARVLDDIGAVEVARGEPRTAIELHRESLRIKRATYGPHHPQVAASARELGSAYSHAERYDEALAQFEHALSTERQARGAKTQYVATLLDDIGRVLRRQERIEEAIDHHRRALVVWEAVLGDPHPDLAISVLNVGYTLNAAGRFADALEQFRRALAMFEATVGSEHPYVVYASNSIASALVDLGRYDEARVPLERVLGMKDVSVDPTLIAETKFTLTHALWGEGQASATERARARRLAHEALASYRTKAERWAPQIEQIEAWLADHA